RADPSQPRLRAVHDRRTRPPRSRARPPRTQPAARLPKSALELLIRHPRSSFRLHLEELEPAVVDTLAPDGHTPPVDDSACAGVRRKSAHAIVQLLRQATPVELAVGGGDLLRVRRAF